MKRFSALLPIAATFIALAFVLGSAGSSRADKGGCPNANAANGGDHASENSAHGPPKQDGRNCIPDIPGPEGTPGPEPTAGAEATPTPTPELTPNPTPEPTPTQEATPTPSPEATPTATPAVTPEPTPAGTPTPEPTPTPVPTADIEVVEFALLTPPTATAGVAFQVTAQATVRNNGPVSPAIADTTFTPALPAGCTATTGAMTVQNTILNLGVNAFFSRSWMVTCLQLGPVQLDMGVNSALDATQIAIDPNLANNSKSASGSIVVN